MALQVKCREIKVATTSNAGSGDMYEHPLKVDYHNPIETVLYAGYSDYRMRFVTRDGDSATKHTSPASLGMVATIKPDTEYVKIQVWYCTNYFRGIRFLNKDNECVLQAGHCSGSV